MSAFTDLTALPPDPLLGLMAAFRADDRPGKVDLGVGVFKDSAGNTPILDSVKRAERQLFDAETTKVYEGPRGNLDFCAGVEALVYGGAAPAGRVTSFTTPGGCGALGLAAMLQKRVNPEGAVWISDPCWPNHPHVARSAGLRVADYPYEPGSDGAPDLDRALSWLDAAEAGDMLLLQGPCHNPSGVDFSLDQWRGLAAVCVAHGLVPLIDIAYHGFAVGLDADLAGVQAFLAAVPEALVSYSCSKNFGLYRERAGVLIAQAETETARDAVQTHLASIARATYSMPPAHGAGIVATILGDDDLRALWIQEVDAMRGRLKTLRRGFATSLRDVGKPGAAQGVETQNGMFSLLSLVESGAQNLRDERAIYVPGSGRINVAGLPEDGLDALAAAFAPYLAD